MHMDCEQMDVWMDELSLNDLGICRGIHSAGRCKERGDADIRRDSRDVQRGPRATTTASPSQQQGHTSRAIPTLGREAGSCHEGKLLFETCPEY